MPVVSSAVTSCPENYSEYAIDSNSVIVPADKQCPDGYIQVYSVSDCADENASDVCAICDSGYALGNGQNCMQLCGTDVSKVKFGGNLSFNLLKERTTTPALNILASKNQVCYVNLEPGNAAGLNFELPDGTQYHAVNNAGGYRVCAKSYKLSYSCGGMGGTPPDAQMLLPGQWYTVSPNVGNCDVAPGNNFAGWYLDGVKIPSYMIHVFNFTTDKTLVARYENQAIKYYCKYDADVDDWKKSQSFNGEPVVPLGVFCPAYKTGITSGLESSTDSENPNDTVGFWFTPFTDSEQAQLNAIMPYEELDENAKNLVAPFFGKTDIIEGKNGIMAIYGLMEMANDESDGDGYESVFSRLLQTHLYGPDVGDDAKWRLTVSGETSLYALYVYEPYEVTYNFGNVPVFGDLGFAFLYILFQPYYGVNFKFSEFMMPTCNTGLSVAGYEIDGKKYDPDDTVKWLWTSGKTVDVLFDMNLSATFDCGWGVLENPETATKTYKQTSVYGDTDATFVIDAECIPSDGNKVFAGWRVDTPRYEPLNFAVGDTVDWFEVSEKTNPNYIVDDMPPGECKPGISSGEYVFNAVYEDIPDGIKYYCEYDAAPNQYVYNQPRDAETLTVMDPMCVSTYPGATPMFWFNPFTDDEIAQLNAIIPYDSLGTTSQKFVAPFMGYTDKIHENALIFSLGMSGGTLISESSEYNTLFQELINKHIYVNDDSGTHADVTNVSELYALYIYMPANLSYNSGNIITYGRGLDGFFDFVYWPYYGVEYNLDDLAPSTCNTDIVHVGYEYNGDVYGIDEKFTWLYEDGSASVNMLFDIDIGITFDCGDYGTLAEGSVASKSYKSDEPETGNIDANMKLDSVCVPNDDSHVFIGWEPADIHLNGTYYYGSDFDLLYWLHQSNPHAGAMGDVSQCPNGMRSGFVNFNAVYADKHCDEYEVYMYSAGDDKSAVIQAMMDVMGLGMDDATSLVDGAPITLTMTDDASQAAAIQYTLQGAGATVEVRCGGIVVGLPPPPPAVNECDVILRSSGGCKINVIKEVRAITGLGLKEAKDMVDGAPSTIKEGLSLAEAEEIKKKIEGLECTSGAAEIELKCSGGYIETPEVETPEVEECNEVNVILTGYDAGNTIYVIKVVKEVTGLGLAEAKEVVVGVPSTIKEGVSPAEAEEIKEKLIEVGGTVELKC